MHYRLMNEWGVDWPPWAEDGLCPPGTPALSEAVTNVVLAWTADFSANYSMEWGWLTERAARGHERQAHRLLELIERDLGPEDDVELHYWETRRVRGR